MNSPLITIVTGAVREKFGLWYLRKSDYWFRIEALEKPYVKFSPARRKNP